MLFPRLDARTGPAAVDGLYAQAQRYLPYVWYTVSDIRVVFVKKQHARSCI